eukprot:scaffold1237_cov403-Prasinococcus_capsulatus_cf.AAC.4
MFGQAIRVLTSKKAYATSSAQDPSPEELEVLDYLMLARSHLMIYVPSRLTHLATRSNGRTAADETP